MCLALFLVFLGTMMAATLYGFKKGDPDRYMASLDRHDNFCGFTPGFEEYPKLFLTSLSGNTRAIFNSGVCVKKCPTGPSDKIECPKNDADQQLCSSVASSLYETHTILGYCMPDMASIKKDRPNDYQGWQAAFNSLLNSNPAGRQLQDMYLSSRAIYGSMAMSLVYCVLFIYLMSWFAEYIAWAVVGLAQLGLVGATFYFINQFMAIKGQSVGEPSQKKPEVMLALGIAFGIFSFIFCLCVYCGFNSLRVAINVVDASADFLAKTKRIILVPVFYFFVTVVIFSTWLFCMLAINSIGDIKADTSLVIQKKHVARTDAENRQVNAIFLFMLFGILWIMAFIRAKSAFITMVSATTYYFNSNEKVEGDADVGLGFKFAYMYHAGSLAFGSFVIALVQFIKIVFMYLAEQAKKASGDNAAVRIIVGCAECIIKCVEKICEYINKSAYAYIAVSGDNFCSGAWNGFLLNVKHTLQFAWANFLANMFIFIGKVALVVLNVFSCYMIMKYITKDLDEISSPNGPLAAVGVVTYISASIFLGLFDEAVLALMTCLAVDTDLNGHPKHGPPTFHDALEGLDSHSDKKVS